MADMPVEEPNSSADDTEQESTQSQQTTADYERYARPEKPIRNWTRLLSIFIITLVLAVIIAGAYLFLKNHKTAKPPPTQTAQSASAKKISSTKSYTSPNLYLTFSYPASWTILDNGGGIMTVTSPLMSMKDPTGQTTKGKIVMTLQTTATQLPGFVTGKNAGAVLASQKVTYSKPTETQRADTYVSFVSYPTTAAANGLDAIYITGNNGYVQNQAIPQADLLQANPIIGLTFIDSAGKPLTVSSANWSDTSFSTPILNMLKSLQIT